MNELNTKLGVSTNLLNGYDPAWLSSGKGNNAIFTTNDALLKVVPVTFPSKTGNWSFPTVTLHDTAEDLLSQLLPCRIKNPIDSLETAEIPAGSLMLNDKDRPEALKTLSGTLGIDLSKSGGFALVRLKRTDGETFHPSVPDGYLSYILPTHAPKAIQRAAQDLKRFNFRETIFSPDSLTAEEARGYLDFFYANGTHYVSGVVTGDEIFQVFRFAPAPYREIKATYERSPHKLSGAEAVLFIQFTAPYKQGVSGYTEEHGKLLCLSQCNQLEQDLEKQAWTDDIYSKKASIFIPFRYGGNISQADLNQSYTGQTAIEIQLTSLTLFMEYSRRMIWERVFKGAILQKYQTDIRPNFCKYFPEESWDKLRQSSPAGTLSTLCTPLIDLYTPATDLDELKFAARRVVERFTLTTQVLTHSGEKVTEIPGTDVLVNAQTIALEGEYAKKITLADRAMERFTCYYQHFYGALLVGNTSASKHFTLCDGLIYEFAPGTQKRHRIQISGKNNTPPADTGTEAFERLSTGIRLSFSFAESMYGVFTRENATTGYLRESFRWITRLIPENTTGKEWLELRLKCLDLLHCGREDSLGSFVPVLTEEAYQEEIDKILDYIDAVNQKIDSYQRQLENRKQEELTVDTAKQLNENIISSGKLLYDYIRANADQQKELAGWYKSIVDGKKKELDSCRTTINHLWSELDAKRSEFINLSINYDQSVKGKIEQRVTVDAITFVFTAAKTLFTLGTGTATPASTIEAVKEMGATMQRIQQFISTTETIDQICTGASQSVRSLADAQRSYDGLTDLITNNLSWDELTANFDGILSQVPEEVDHPALRRQLETTFKLFILKGKAYTNARSAYNSTAKEIYLQQGQQQLVESQVKRLEQLGKELKPARIEDLKVWEIDLVGLTGRLCAIQSDTLGMLAKTFIQRDQSLQYTYLQKPTGIVDFTLEGILKALTEQVRKTNDSKTRLQRYQAFTTEAIDIPVEIPVSELRNGGVYTFNLGTDLREFQLFTDAKILSVVARAEGIESTGNGTYALRLAYNGRPFCNKGMDGEFHLFNTLERGRSYPYQVKDNRPLFSDQGKSWSEGVTRITPFSGWEISFPTLSNPGLRFRPGLTIQVTLTFVLQARIKDDLLCASAPLRLQRSLIDSGIPRKLMAYSSKQLLKDTSASNAQPFPSVEELNKDMKGDSKLNGWDVVFNMLLTNINKVLEKQYNELKINKSYGGKIEADTLIKKKTLKGFTIDEYDARIFNLSYGYPRMEFLVNSDKKAKLSIGITDGYIRSGTKYIGEKTNPNKTKLEQIANIFGIPAENLKAETIDGKEKWVLTDLGDPVSLANGRLESVIELSMARGIVNNNQNILSVVLDLAKGTFDPADIQIEISDEQAIAFSDAVKSYFARHPVYFIINSLDLTGITTLDDLKPNQFLFKVIKTRGEHDILQLFIHTNKRVITQSDYSLTFLKSVYEPIPQGYQTSLMISNQLFFGSILPQSNKSWTLTGKKEKNGQYHSELSNLTIEENIDLTSLNRTTAYGNTYYISKDIPAKFTLENITIMPSENGEMKLSYLGEQDFIVNEVTEPYYYSATSTYTTEIKTTFHLVINAILAIKINTSGRNQTVAITLPCPNVTIEAQTSGGGECGCDSLKSQINAKLKESLPQRLTNKISLNINDFSVFALKNLLFPCKNYIVLKDVYLPSDLLMLGNFIEE